EVAHRRRAVVGPGPRRRRRGLRRPHRGPRRGDDPHGRRATRRPGPGPGRRRGGAVEGDGRLPGWQGRSGRRPRPAPACAPALNHDAVTLGWYRPYGRFGGNSLGPRRPEAYV